MSSSDRGFASHFTDPDQKEGVHKKRTGKGAGVELTMSSEDRINILRNYSASMCAGDFTIMSDTQMKGFKPNNSGGGFCRVLNQCTLNYFCNRYCVGDEKLFHFPMKRGFNLHGRAQ